MQKVSRLTTSFTPESYELSLTLDRVGRTFGGTVTIKGLSHDDGSILLHSKELSIETVTIDGHEVSWEAGRDDELKLSSDQLKAGLHTVVLGYSGKITDQMHGLYPCYYDHEGEKQELLATQFESHHAREVFPCIDEPEAKATFDLTLTTEPDVTVLSNMPIAEQRSEDDRLVTSFTTSPRMSSYLLAFVVGNLHKKSAETASGVEVNIWATPAQRPESLDFALDHAVRSIEFFDDYFDTPYPLPKSDHVALPDFSSGAMENWGLITYREVALLADPDTTTVASKQYIATVISHELSHQWFGNLVTMKWWNNLWLNESFATLMEYLAVDAIHPEWNAWLDFATHESIMALRRDAIDGVQSVQVDVNHPDEITSLFDGAIVYAKGARLMRMCQAYIGHEAFQHGLRSYFAEFAYSNTEAEDLWKHLSKASGKDISHFMNTWISQPGYPVLHVSETGMEQEQFFIGPHGDSDKVWPIPLVSNDPKLPELLDELSIDTEVSQSTRFNVGDTAHFLTHYPADHLARLLEADELNELDRLQLLHEQTLLVRGGYVPSVQLVDLLEHYREETSQSVWDIMAVAFGELKKFVETDSSAEQKLRAFAGRLARPLYDKLGWDIQPDEPEAHTKLRGIILGFMTYSESPDVLAKIDELFESGITAINPEIRPLVISSVVYRSDDMSLIDTLLNTHRETSSADLQQDISHGVTSVKTPELVQHVVGHLTDTDLVRPQDNAHWFVYLIRNRHARDTSWQWLRDNWEWIDETFGGDKSYDYYPRYAASALVTAKQREEYKTFFTPLRSNPSLTRTIDLGLIEIDGRIDLLERDGDAVRKRLVELDD